MRTISEKLFPVSLQRPPLRGKADAPLHENPTHHDDCDITLPKSENINSFRQVDEMNAPARDGRRRRGNDFWPGGQRNPLKRLKTAKRIQGRLSLLL
jgi:hypothetical protein